MKEEQPPIVSVVVPVYNSHSTIAGCIESILRQSFAQLELVVVDDGSNDGSGAICDSYASTDNRILVVHQPNRGRSEARRVGVAHSHGQWVTFVDSDDQLPPHALDSLYNRATADVDIVLGDGDSLPQSERRATIAIGDFRHLAVRGEGNIGVPWGSLYRRSVLKDQFFDLPRDFMMGEDYIFWLRLVFSTDRPVNVVSESVYDKGDDHTSNNFVWTAAYAQRIQDYRMEAIPSREHQAFAEDMLSDRLANLWAVATWSPRKDWERSQFYSDIVRDMQQLGKTFSLRQRIFLALPARMLRRAWTQAGTLANYIPLKI